METPGNLFCVAAPSGTGKSSLVKALLELDSRLAVSVSHTTRRPRGQEVHGREYWFIEEPEFRAMAAQGDFFEWAEVHGNLYGTSRKAIQERLEHGDDVVLEIDVPSEAIIERMSGRLFHIASGRSYHTKFKPPKVAGVDDETGEPLVQRDDDKEATVRKRLDVYESQTRPLVAYYAQWAATGDAQAPRCARISGTGSVDEITGRVMAALGG
jgi:guanylate kinase